MVDLIPKLKQTIKDFIIDVILVSLLVHLKNDTNKTNTIQSLLIGNYSEKKHFSAQYGRFYMIKKLYYEFYARLYNIFQQHIGQTLGCYNNMDSSMVFPILFNVNYYKCLSSNTKSKLLGCDELLSELLGPNKFDKIIELMYELDMKRDLEGRRGVLAPDVCDGASGCGNFNDYNECIQNEGCYWKADAERHRIQYEKEKKKIESEKGMNFCYGKDGICSTFKDENECINTERCHWKGKEEEQKGPQELPEEQKGPQELPEEQKGPQELPEEQTMATEVKPFTLLGKCFSNEGAELNAMCKQYENYNDCMSHPEQSCEWINEKVTQPNLPSQNFCYGNPDCEFLKSEECEENNQCFFVKSRKEEINNISAEIKELESKYEVISNDENISKRDKLIANLDILKKKEKLEILTTGRYTETKINKMIDIVIQELLSLNTNNNNLPSTVFLEEEKEIKQPLIKDNVIKTIKEEAKDAEKVTSPTKPSINDSNIRDLVIDFKKDPSLFVDNHISTWDVSGVTNMQGLFRYMTFNEDISNWDTSNVTDMSFMFLSSSSFNKPLNNWNVSKVTTMNKMFHGAQEFNQPLNNWDVSQVTDMAGMFGYAYKFNQPLNNWDVSQVTDMNRMFNYAKLFNQPLNNWNVSQVTNMGHMFNQAKSFNQTLKWNLSTLNTNTNTNGMFNFSGGSFELPPQPPQPPPTQAPTAPPTQAPTAQKSDIRVLDGNETTIRWAYTSGKRGGLKYDYYDEDPSVYKRIGFQAPPGHTVVLENDSVKCRRSAGKNACFYDTGENFVEDVHETLKKVGEMERGGWAGIHYKGTYREHWDFWKNDFVAFARRNNSKEGFSVKTTMLEKFYKCTKRPEKPYDWEDEPMIIDPTAEKPEDWNDDINGDWEPPMINNPNYKGDWIPPQAPIELIINRMRLNLEIMIPEIDKKITRDFFENLEYKSFEKEYEGFFELLELDFEDEDTEQIKTEKDMYRKLILSELSGDPMRERASDELLNREKLHIFLSKKNEKNKEVMRIFKKLYQQGISNTVIVSFNKFIDNLSSNIAEEMIGETNLVCENYLSNPKEGFVGNTQENQSNKIMKAVLFALLFYIIKSEQVQSILKKMLQNLYKTHSTEHLLIVSMIVFAILYYVINLFI